MTSHKSELSLPFCEPDDLSQVVGVKVLRCDFIGTNRSSQYQPCVPALMSLWADATTY